MNATPPAAPASPAKDGLDDERVAFEHWFSGDGHHPRAVERDSSGSYRLMSAHTAWNTWLARAALATPPSGAVPEPRMWAVIQRDGSVLDAFDTKAEAYELKCAEHGETVEPLYAAQPPAGAQTSGVAPTDPEPLWRALEVIGLGDAEDAPRLATETLIKVGHWTGMPPLLAGSVGAQEGRDAQLIAALRRIADSGTTAFLEAHEVAEHLRDIARAAIAASKPEGGEKQS